MFTIILTVWTYGIIIILLLTFAALLWIRKIFRLPPQLRHSRDAPSLFTMKQPSQYVIRTIQSEVIGKWDHYETLLEHMIENGELIETWGFRTSLVAQGRTNKSRWNHLMIYKLPSGINATEFAAKEQIRMNKTDPAMYEEFKCHSRTVPAHLIPSCVIGGNNTHRLLDCAFYVEYISVQPDALADYAHSMDTITAPAMSLLSKQGAIHSFTVFEMDFVNKNARTDQNSGNWNQIHITAGTPLSFLPFSSRFNRAIIVTHPQVGGLEGAIKRWEQWCSYARVDVMKLVWHYRNAMR